MFGGNVKRFAYAVTAFVLCLVINAGCSNQNKNTTGQQSKPATPVITPGDASTGVAPANSIKVVLERGSLDSVSVTSSSGVSVSGAFNTDKRSWTSSGKLAFSSTYTVKTQVSGVAESTISHFTTQTRPDSSHSVRASSFIGDGKKYGMAMPIIIKTNVPLKTAEARAAFERTLQVASEPTTVGAWGWINSKEVHFRPQTYWAQGSQVRFTVDSAGRNLTAGLWGRTDLSVGFTTGTQREIRADAKTHQLSVVENGVVVKTIAASLGKPTRPSSSGTMVLIDKRPEALFDSSTYGLAVDDPDGYRAKVQLVMRLTWGGEFIHSAPWSVADQGKRNVSHGCINLAPAQAQWVYSRVVTGDPVTVTNTGTSLKENNGWTDWNVSFTQWQKKSFTGSSTTIKL